MQHKCAAVDLGVVRGHSVSLVLRLWFVGLHDMLGITNINPKPVLLSFSLSCFFFLSSFISFHIPYPHLFSTQFYPSAFIRPLYIFIHIALSHLLISHHQVQRLCQCFFCQQGCREGLCPTLRFWSCSSSGSLLLQLCSQSTNPVL